MNIISAGRRSWRHQHTIDHGCTQYVRLHLLLKQERRILCVNIGIPPIHTSPLRTASKTNFEVFFSLVDGNDCSRAWQNMHDDCLLRAMTLQADTIDRQASELDSARCWRPWLGFTNSADKGQIEAFVRRGVKLSHRRWSHCIATRWKLTTNYSEQFCTTPNMSFMHHLLPNRRNYPIHSNLAGTGGTTALLVLRYIETS